MGEEFLDAGGGVLELDELVVGGTADGEGVVGPGEVAAGGAEGEDAAFGPGPGHIAGAEVDDFVGGVGGEIGGVARRARAPNARARVRATAPGNVLRIGRLLGTRRVTGFALRVSKFRSLGGWRFGGLEVWRFGGLDPYS